MVALVVHVRLSAEEAAVPVLHSHVKEAEAAELHLNCDSVEVVELHDEMAVVEVLKTASALRKATRRGTSPGHLQALWAVSEAAQALDLRG